MKKASVKKQGTVKKEVVKKPMKTAVRAVKPSAASAKKGGAKKVIKVLFVASEASPFAGTGGLGEVIGSLPQALNARGGIDARVIIPYYKENIGAEYAKDFKFLCCFNVNLGWRTLYCGIYEYDYRGVKYYFVDNEYYFKRPGLYGFYDDGERFIYFCRAAVEALHLIDFIPDVLHCNDWQAALVPVYYKLFYMHFREGYRNIKTVFTIHNVEYQGKFGKDCIEDLFGISRQELHSLEFDGCINLLKAAMDYSDVLSTVSNSYASELTENEHACGLAEVVKWNSQKMTGILNGIDYRVYNPAADPALPAAFCADAPAGKVKCKAELQKILGLPERADVPLLAVVSRLVAHKGIDILKGSLERVLEEDVQVVILGTGDADYEEYFRYMERTYGKRLKALIAFNKDMAHKIYGAADIYLMPSRSEPCGLSQMVACRYGALPVVHAVGGLKDSIGDCGDGEGIGFTFREYGANDFLNALSRALSLYADKPEWKKVVARAMRRDFSWDESAKAYADFYRKLF